MTTVLTAPRRFAWFDCLRCLAVMLVILLHATDFSRHLAAPLHALIRYVQLAGWMGVDLFFIMSGFLVSGLIFDEHDHTGAVNLPRFLIRRGFKIIPPFYFLTAVTVAYNLVVFHSFKFDHLAHDLLFLQSYRLGMWPHSWTLAVEVHFYLLLGWLLSALSRRPGIRGQWLHRLPVILFGVLLGCFLARLVNSWMRFPHFDWHHEIKPSHLHLDVLAAGVLLRYGYQYHPGRLRLFQRAPLLWICLGLVLVSFSVNLWRPHSPTLTALLPLDNYLGFGLILFQATQLPFPTAGLAKWMVWPFDYLGKHSYSIYLWHLPVKMWVVDQLLPGRGVLNFLCFLLGSFVVGAFFSEILEMPVLAMRNRLFPSATSKDGRAAPETRTALVV